MIYLIGWILAMAYVYSNGLMTALPLSLQITFPIGTFIGTIIGEGMQERMK
jgi:hypothetical protein